MATVVRSFVNRLISLFLLLFYLGCFSIPTTRTRSTTSTSAATAKGKGKKRRFSSSPPHQPSGTEKTRRKALIPFLSYLKPIFSFKKPSQQTEPMSRFNLHRHHPSSVRSSELSTTSTIITTRKRSSGSFTELLNISAADDPQQPKRVSPFSFQFQIQIQIQIQIQGDMNIFPCPTCGEVFQKASHLEQHQSTKHSVTELLDGDSAKNIVQIIFQSGWKGKGSRSPTIHRIMKIHNSSKVVARFEEYREATKTKAASSSTCGGRRHERCIADGNEVLRFHCSTFVCSLGGGGVCGQEWCGVCGIISRGFSRKLEGISTMGSSERAHESIPEEMKEEFAFMNVRRAMLLCRVVAGRVALASDANEDKEDGGFDSVVVDGGSGTRTGTGTRTIREGEELLVFDPRAVLPCFVIIYAL